MVSVTVDTAVYEKIKASDVSLRHLIRLGWEAHTHNPIILTRLQHLETKVGVLDNRKTNLYLHTMKLHEEIKGLRERLEVLERKRA